MSNKIPDSFKFMLDNRKIIENEVRKGSTLSKAWEILLDKIPGIREEVKFNTFKAYAKFLNVISKELDEKENLKEELDKVSQERANLQKELGKIRHEMARNKTSNAASDRVPKNVDGWGVQRKGDYFRLFKKIEGKVKWLHIGRKWNLELAKKKIRNFKRKPKE